MARVPASGNVVSRLDPLEALAARADVPQQEDDGLWRVHRQRVVAVALEADVIAEPLRLLGRVGMAVHVHHQAEVVGGRPLPLVEPDGIGESERDNGLADAVLHGLPQPQIGSQ